ncbi:MAG: hypothetical protein SVZ03_04465 [Spirochaetota bacterium]|nr:hypothetical protein [Spirochaetota bacterium]
MDNSIINLIQEYHLAIHHVISISGIIAGFVVISGFIRFSIAIRRRAKGIYPPATSQMENH